VLAERRMVGEIATRGLPAPIQASRRWLVERTHAWELVRQAALVHRASPAVVEFWLALANAAIVLGRLVRRAWTHYRWDRRPRRRP